jgi:hypothetical protein
VDLFKSFFNLGVSKRHRKPLLGGGDLTRKHLNMVPAKYKYPANANKKIETLKKMKTGKFVCDHKDVDFIIKNFLHNKLPQTNEHKTLGGKMNIKFYHDPSINKWVIAK